jgi:hypothetical protein
MHGVGGGGRITRKQRGFLTGVGEQKINGGQVMDGSGNTNHVVFLKALCDILLIKLDLKVYV